MEKSTPTLVKSMKIFQYINENYEILDQMLNMLAENANKTELYKRKL